MNRDQRRASGDSDPRTRGRLVAATRRLLAAGPADALTSRAIVAAADANLAAITYYFGSKEQLVTEAMIAAARELLAPLMAVLRSDADPTTQMLDAVVLLTRMLDERRDDAAAYLQALAASATNPAIASALQALHEEVAEPLAAQIEVQRAAAQLPSWVVPAAMAKLIIAVVHGTLVGTVVAPENADESAIGAQFAQLLLAARTTPRSG